MSEAAELFAQRDRRARLVLVGAVLLYVVTFSALSVVRYQTHHAATFDLGYFAQVVWNTAHGRWFETSISRSTNDTLIGSYLGEHVTPILALFAPLYRLWPDPRLLLILQSAALGLAALPLYALARRGLARPGAAGPGPALAIACCYLIYPALGFLNLFDFHPIAFSIPFVLLAAWALEEGRMGLFWGGVLLALSTKEEMVVPLGVWGLVTLLRRERRWIGVGLLTLAATWAAVSFGLLIPALNEGQGYKFLGLWSGAQGLVGQPAPGGVAQATAAASPEAVALFLIHLFLPLGFVPFLGPRSLVVALPSLLYLLLGRRAAFHSVGYHYPAVLIPWLFLAAVDGLGRLRSRGRLYRLGLAFLVIGTLGTNIVLNPILLHGRNGHFRRGPYHDEIGEALAAIPQEAAVAAVNRFGPRLANRRVLVALEYPPPLRLDHVGMTDYVILDLVDCRTVPAVDQRAAYAEIVAQVLDTRLFRVGYWSGRILLLERGEAPEGELTEVLDYVTGLVADDRPCWP